MGGKNTNAVHILSAGALYGTYDTYGSIGIGWYFLYNLVALAVFSYANIYIHEFGHVAAAKIAGLGVEKVVIGNGRELKRYSFFDIPVVITNNVNGGYTHPARLAGKFLRLRLFTFAAGGIAVQVLITALWVELFGFELRGFFGADGIDLASAFIVSNILIIMINIIPMAIENGGIEMPNDGLRLLTVPFLKDNEVQELVALNLANKAMEHFRDGRYALAADMLQEYSIQYPAETGIKLTLAEALMRTLKLEEAEKTLVNVLEEDHEKERGLWIYTNLAWLSLLKNDEASLVDADTYSKTAFDLDPHSPVARATRACVLIERGYVEEGTKLLEQSSGLYEYINNETNNPAAYFSIAYSYIKRGEKEKAFECLHRGGLTEVFVPITIGSDSRQNRVS